MRRYSMAAWQLAVVVSLGVEFLEEALAPPQIQLLIIPSPRDMILMIDSRNMSENQYQSPKIDHACTTSGLKNQTDNILYNVRI